jgi:hypothetical protein
MYKWIYKKSNYNQLLLLALMARHLAEALIYFFYLLNRMIHH